MSLKDELQSEVDTFFREKFETEETEIVPSTDYSKLTFGNKGLIAELAFLFIDIRKSSDMHTRYGHVTTAKLYESFHRICLKIIESNNGNVRAFDGDRIMGVFSGKAKRTNAVKSAMKIRYAMTEILNPKLKTPISIGCGVDVGEILITKVGKARDIDTRDLVWIGKACNYAAHLTQDADNSIIISENVYDSMHASVKYKDENEKTTNMWDSKNMELKSRKTIKVYESNWWWAL